MTQPRQHVVDPDVTAVYHCYSRCVRRTFLCGQDGDRDYEHRKQWIYERLVEMASIFSVVVGGYAIMSNHLHLVVKTLPDWAKAWSDQEVARRWYRLYPPKDNDGQRRAATQEEIEHLAAQKEQIAVFRRRLHDLSWFMKCLKEPIAKDCNAEEGVRGHFWEARFGCERLLDEQAILTCCVYVDLNWIRAALADTPETSTYTSVKERIDAWRAANIDPEIDLWLAPIAYDPIGNAVQAGLLSISLHEYLQIVDLTGRVVRSDKPAAIPSELAPILERLEIDPNRWATQMRRGGRGVGSVIGAAASRAREALRRGGRWVVSAMRVERTPATAAPA